MAATFTGPGGGWNTTGSNADTKGGPNGAPGAASTLKGKGSGFMPDVSPGNDYDGDDFMDGGNGCGGSAGTPEGHESIVPGG